MKNGIAILCVLALLFSLGACRPRPGKEDPTGEQTHETTGGETEAPQGDSLQVRLIGGVGTGRLVLAGLAGGEVYTANEKELTVYLDGKAASPSDLENGMRLTVDPGYTVLETFPALLTGATLRALGKGADRDDHGDLCGLYLKVLGDLWEDDSGLNNDIRYISVDLDDAPGALTEGEKAAIAWIFSSSHGKEGLRFSFEELRENGYIDKDVLYWEDGVLLSIKKTEKGTNGAHKITFDAQKWRSGLGAIFYMGCTAERGTGVRWKDYKAGSFAIA